MGEWRVEGGKRRMYVVLFSEFFVEGCAHYYSADAAWGSEMGLPRLSPRGVTDCTEHVNVGIYRRYEAAYHC